MIAFFKRLFGFRAKPHALIFRDGRAAFEYCCEFMSNEILVGKGLMGLVLDARMVGARVAVKVRDDDIQECVVAIASGDGGFPVFTLTAGPVGPLLKPGDLVLWTPMAHHATPATFSADERCGWIGIIGATLRPEWCNGTWRGGERFRLQ